MSGKGLVRKRYSRRFLSESATVGGHFSVTVATLDTSRHKTPVGEMSSCPKLPRSRNQRARLERFWTRVAIGGQEWRHEGHRLAGYRALITARNCSQANPSQYKLAVARFAVAWLAAARLAVARLVVAQLTVARLEVARFAVARGSSPDALIAAPFGTTQEAFTMAGNTAAHQPIHPFANRCFTHSPPLRIMRVVKK